MWYLFHVFRSFLPLRNPIGFGAADFVELTVAAILVALVVARARLAPAARKLAARTAWSMLVVAVLPVALRLTLLAHDPAPLPSSADDASYLLLGDTLAHGRLSNPPHPLHQFFESTFALQEPRYSSIYPLGQGIFLALGEIVFRQPWAGVLLSEACFCALCYWMLRGWVAPEWALAGGLLAAIQFGPLNSWMNSYWGGAVSGIAGCLVFGALPRLRASYRAQGAVRTRPAVLLGAGLGLQLLTRPYESIFLVLSAAVFLLLTLRGSRANPGGLFSRALLAPSVALVLAALPAVALTLAQSKAVTGSWTTLPYMLSRDQYGVPTTFTFQPNPVPHRELTPEQQIDYETQSQVHASEAAMSFPARLAERFRYVRFFLLPPLYVALVFGLMAPVLRKRGSQVETQQSSGGGGSRLSRVLRALKENRDTLWAAGTIGLFAVGVTLYPYFHPNYVAAIACLFLLLAVTALARMRPGAARWLFLLAVAHFVFFYSVHASGDEDLFAGVWPYESWDYINHGDLEGRRAIYNRLAETPGKQLVFVRYGALHSEREWITNPAVIDGARVVWALDLGAADNEKLLRYYPDRTAWLVEPDAVPPRLTRYGSGSPFLDVQ
jgi:hypothetical protein